ncbi:translocon-associated protein subunit beta [Artemisia annua]|uniref:Translocon-associated protein subunit beta n=1 Tax=Artemisia annua TaxID=35608 RepID=A0A2U1QJM2_ARTAN|nr:translocon-associated protein subunit beta [Artemisia annua]
MDILGKCQIKINLTYKPLLVFRAAYDISLTDVGWSPEIFSIISGNTSTSWEKLGMRHIYTTSRLPLEILSDKPQEINLKS